MKHLITLFLALTLLATTAPASAEIPHTINYQGKATDESNRPINGGYTMTFTIYDAQAGGNLIWTETYEHDNKVAVENGVFSVQLGSVDPVNNPLDIAFDKPYWISIAIEDPGTKTTNELSPRQAITSVGYAYRTKEADHAVTADSLIASDVPSGVIVMWSGSKETIPDGWVICNGENGTPDLSDKFIIGAIDADGVPMTNIEGELKQSGGSTTQPPTTTKSATGASDNVNGDIWYLNSMDHIHEFVPPYYALAFIMKE